MHERAVGASQLIAIYVQRDARSRMQCHGPACGQRTEVDGAWIYRVVARNPARQHSGIDLAPIRCHEMDIPAHQRLFGKIGENLDMGMAAPQQDEALHAPAASIKHVSQLPEIPATAAHAGAEGPPAHPRPTASRAP